MKLVLLSWIASPLLALGCFSLFLYYFFNDAPITQLLLDSGFICFVVQDLPPAAAATAAAAGF